SRPRPDLARDRDARRLRTARVLARADPTQGPGQQGHGRAFDYGLNCGWGWAWRALARATPTPTHTRCSLNQANSSPPDSRPEVSSPSARDSARATLTPTHTRSQVSTGL